MKIVRTKLSGELTKGEQNYFGGPYGFWERLLNGGVGSNKLIYRNGLHDLDILQRDIEGEIVFINLELLPNGLIIRANCNQRKIILGVKISEIKSIQLLGIQISDREDSKKPAYRGEITISEIYNPEIYKFSVIAGEFKDLIRFFMAKELTGKFTYSLSSDK